MTKTEKNVITMILVTTIQLVLLSIQIGTKQKVTEHKLNKILTELKQNK